MPELNPNQFTPYAQMTRDEFEKQPNTWFHGTISGVVGGAPGRPFFHVGTHRAALQATGARGQGNANGLRTDQDYQDAMDNSRRSGKPIHGSVGQVAPDPKIIAGRIVGPMSNMPQADPRNHGDLDYQGRSPYAYGDWKANGMQRRLKHQGVYYKNVGEDEGSISAILPKRSHFKTHEDYLVEARAQGKPYNAEGYTEIPGQQKMTFNA